VAAFAVAAVGHPAAENARLALGGPEALSWRRIVDSFGQVLGQQVPVQFVTPGEPIPGAPAIVPAVLAGMETSDSPIPMAETARTFGVELTPLEAVARSMVAWQGATEPIRDDGARATGLPVAPFHGASVARRRGGWPD
jgi:uncharacterized protein YbjT (DUF2867 family)